MNTSETTPDYWDCQCPRHYIHPKALKVCPVCGDLAEEAPDSLVAEVKKMRGERGQA